MLSEVGAALAELPLLEWWAVGLALGYVILAARNSVWCWPFAFVSSCLWAYQVWFAYDLLFDTVLNALYAVLAILGLYKWAVGSTHNAGEVQQSIQSMSWREHAYWIVGGVVVTVLLAVLAKAYTTAQLAGIDALTTVGSVIGSILLVQRRLENWLYLLVMDVLYVGIYWERGSVLFAGLFVLYCVLAVVGYRNWQRMMRSERSPLPE